jgi:superfamily II DNA or RNA helicase
LSFKAEGVEWTPAYKSGWNGITYLMNKKGIFNSGLIAKVRGFLYDNAIEYIEEDRREPVQINQEIDLTERLKEMKMVPRDHQTKALEACLQNRKGIVRAATASGKSLCIGMLTAKLNTPTIIYVISLDLLKQFHDFFVKLFDEPIGYVGGGICKIERINIVTVQTVARALKLDKKEILIDDEELEDFDETNSEKIIKMLQKTKLHVIDECHVSTTSSLEQIYKNIDPEYIYGFSGTPFRGNNTDLLVNSVLGEQLINISASELIEKGILPQPIIKFLPIPKMRSAGDSYLEVYKNYIVENDVRNKIIIKSVKELSSKGYICLVLFKQIKHGKILSDMMKENNINFEILDGNDSLERRTAVKEMAENKKLNVILASTIYDIGVSIDIISALILAGSGKSFVKCLQRIGRALRSYPGKKNVAIVDFYDQVKYLKNHSKIRHEIYSSEKGFKVLDCKEMR